MFVPSAALLVMLSSSPEGPSLGVLSLKAEVGVEPGAANVLSDLLIEKLREEKAFARVVGFKEIEDAMSLEQQRQLLSCDTGSCLAEIAGAIGVDLVMAGSIGKLGEVLVVTLKIIESRNGAARATLSQTFKGGLDAVVTHVGALAHNLLVRGEFVAGPMQPIIEAPPPAPLEKSVPTAPPVEQPGPSRWPLVVGGVAAVAGFGTFLVGMLVAGIAAAVLIVPTQVGIPTPFLPIDVKRKIVVGTGGALAGVSVLAVLSSFAIVVLGLIGAGSAAWLGR